MRTSSNYGLKLMEGTDNVRRQDFVDNFTKIDTEMRVIENGGYPIVEATGTNSYTGSTARIKTLTKGTKLTLFVGADATGNCSLNLNGYGAKSIKDSNKNIVKNLKANVPYNLCYNGSDFILQGKGGGGNLVAKYLLDGYYGEGDNGRVDGTMVNRGAPTANLNCGGTYNLQEGYYSGGKVTANSLATQMANNGVTLTSASQLISGIKAISKDGKLLTGNATIASLGGYAKITETQTITKTGTMSVTSSKFNYILGYQVICHYGSKSDDTSLYGNRKTGSKGNVEKFGCSFATANSLTLYITGTSSIEIQMYGINM